MCFPNAVWTGQAVENSLVCNGKVSVVPSRFDGMTMLSVIPQEFFDGVPVPGPVTLDGELLGALDDTPGRAVAG